MLRSGMDKSVKDLLILGTILLVSVLLLAFGGKAKAHYLDYSASNSNGRIVYVFNDNLSQKYRDYSNRATREWDEEKAATNSANWPLMNPKTSSNSATLNVGACLNCDTALGYYQHYPGTKVDLIRLDQAGLNQTSLNIQQKVTTHEFGHAGALDHNNIGCAYTVMGGPNAPCGVQPIAFPGSHDRSDVNNSPRLWNSNNYAVNVEKRTVLEKERDDEGHVVSKTVAYPDGSFRIYEYAPHKTH